MQALALAGLCGLPTGHAQLTIEIDMDTGTAGIQSVSKPFTAADLGKPFTAAVWLTVPPGSTGLEFYKLSIQFDNTELQLNPPLGGWATTEIDPDGGGPWGVNGGPVAESNNIGGGLGQVSSVGAMDFSIPPAIAPIMPGAPPWVAATINFTIVGIADDGNADITPGLWALADKLRDSAGNPVPAPITWNSGQLVPEPQTYGLCAGLALLGWASYRRWRKTV